jgi:hypothetical protein
MGKEPKQFSLQLTEDEAQFILEPSGDGGQQLFHEALRGQLASGKRTMILDDANLGKLVRYMTQYGSGGFQGRLRKAFKRSLIEIISRE